MNKTLLIGFAIAAILTGCAGTQSHVRLMEAGGTIRVDAPDAPGYDYNVYIKNQMDIGWDGGKQEDRKRYVDLMFQDSCESSEIIKETPIDTGTYLTGKRAVTWVLHVKCNGKKEIAAAATTQQPPSQPQGYSLQ